jgi:hypothetical protein
MFRRLFLLLLLASAVTALAQGNSQQPQGDKGQKKPDSDSTLGTVTNTGLNQNVVSATDLSNSELLARSRTIFVISDSVFVKKADMEKYLLRQKELEDYRLHVVQNQKDADLILHIKRIPFTNNFPYSITDRVSSIVVMQGEINAFPSKVPEKIAAALAEKLAAANKKQPEAQTTPK